MGNKAATFGGGMYNGRSNTTMLENCFFADNEAAFGGGLANKARSTDSSLADLVNCTFSGNEATYGGAMYNYYSDPMLTNCALSGNEADTSGGAMYNVVSDPIAINCIFWSNTPDQIYNGGSIPAFAYCDIEDSNGSGVDWDDDLGDDLGGNIDADPCIADVNNAAGYDGIYGTYDDGLRLCPNSPGIDAADGNWAPLTDAVGLERVDINGVDHNGVGEPNYADLGAYESYSGYGVDDDNDGLFNYEEELLGTNPDSNDEDGDGIVDGNEFNLHRTNPFSTDTDGDGLSDSEEINTYLTSPILADTDKDGMDDGWEVTWDFDPLDGSDAGKDWDGDGKTNLQEYTGGTNPHIYNAVVVTVYEYDNAGQVTKETVKTEGGATAAVAQYEYDKLGRRWQERRWAGTGAPDDTNDMITLYSYYTPGDVNETVRKGVNSTDPNAIERTTDLITRNYYNRLGRLTQVKDANGADTCYYYRQGGDVNEIEDPRGNKTYHYYDSAGRLEEIVDQEDHYRLNYYDSLGRTIKQIACDSSDSNLMQTRLEYDGAGHVRRQAVMADADANDNDAISVAVDMVTDYNYADTNGLLIGQKIYYGGSSYKTAATSYYYDDMGRLTTTIDPCDNQTIITYNQMGQITRRRQIDENPLAGEPNLVITTDYIYDSLGRVLQQIEKPDTEDANTWHVTTYYYNVLGGRIQQTNPAGVVTAYSYDALGRLIQKIADYGGTEKINQTTEYGYDRLGRQVSITGYAVSETEQKTQYEYDNADRITKVTYPDGNEITYGYNSAGRVIEREDQRGIVTTYSYDGVYNMTQKLVDGKGVV
ncbi:MAG: hypothetical protein ACYTAN_17080, partial [Planctomycetota bacterium]